MALFRLIDRLDLRMVSPATVEPASVGGATRDARGDVPSAAPRAAPRDTALDAALGRPYRLPSFARNYTFHHGEPRLARALKPLQGKFSVVNPLVVLPLPPLVQDRVRRLAHRTRDVDPADPYAAGPLRALALHEPLQPVVRHEARGTAPSMMPGRDIFFWAELRYRVVLAGDAHTAGDAARAADAPAVAGEPIQWFHVALLVPDADALRQMAPPTAHFYRHVTGRLGGSSRDCYWYLDTWERFHEEGQVIGCVSPALVEHGHVAGAASARARTPAPRQPTEEDFLFGDVAALVPTRFGPYTPRFERRGFVPPGYCLIHYFATVEVAAGRGASQGAAA